MVSQQLLPELRRISRKARRYAIRNKKSSPALFIVTSNENHPGTVLLPNLGSNP